MKQFFSRRAYSLGASSILTVRRRLRGRACGCPHPARDGPRPDHTNDHKARPAIPGRRGGQ